jgi:ABC-type polysaccharide/polyol phosphate transport system ATPase subunit
MHAIEAKGISKRFRIVKDPVRTLKDRFLHLRGQRYRDLWALKELDLTVEQGETLGMLGHNGSGKSTLLKCIAGILLPTTGEVRVRGRIASLLELGAGFHPDLSGRENVFINASFLGIPKREIARRFDDIVAFAELEDAIDRQVKYYSSGMFVRLGFAVAVNVDPDILLVDEVLSVGDELFQQKCLDRVKEFQEEGRTILFVSHSSDLVRRICGRAIVLHHGECVADGEPGESIRIYREHLHGQMSGSEERLQNDSPLSITHVALDFPESEHRHYLLAGEPLKITVGYVSLEPVPDVVISIAVYDPMGNVIHGADTEALGLPLPLLYGRGDIVFELDYVPLLDGLYPFAITLSSRSSEHRLDWTDPEKYSFRVVSSGHMTGSVALPLKAHHVPGVGASTIPR